MENILSKNHTSLWTAVFCRNKQHWTYVTSVRNNPYFYTLLCTTTRGYKNWQCIMVSSSQYLSNRKRPQIKLCKPHMIFISICWWFKSTVWALGPTSVSVSSSGYLKFKLYDSNFSRGKKNYCTCYWDNITHTHCNLCEYKWKPPHFSRYSEFEPVKVGEYLTYTACSLLLTTNEFIRV